MATKDAVDLEFERRRRAIQAEIVAEGSLLTGDVAAIAGACAREHPLLYLGGGVAAGAFVARAATSPAGSRSLISGLFRVASGALRILPSGSMRPF